MKKARSKSKKVSMDKGNRNTKKGRVDNIPSSTKDDRVDNCIDNDDNGSMNKAMSSGNGKSMTPLEHLAKLSRRKVSVIPQWGWDPTHRARMRMVVRAAMDMQKMGIAMQLRMASPTQTNPAQLEDDDLSMIVAVGAGARQFEDAIKRSMKSFLNQSEIGLWIREQPGLNSGWLGGFTLAELPDVYDAGICLKCGIHLTRCPARLCGFPDAPDSEMRYFHPAPPEKKDGSQSQIRCEYDGQLMEPGTYRMHERKPSTFVQFAGLGTEPAWLCPKCRYLLRYNSSHKAWGHPNYTNLPEGVEPCQYRGWFWQESKDSEVPRLAFKATGGGTRKTMYDGDEILEALETRASPRSAQAGVKRPFKSLLRAKLLGKNGVFEAFNKAGHPKYRKIYLDYKNRVQQRDPHKSKGWIDNMAKRAVISRFLIDLFIKWRECEGLPCRPPYEEEKLGIVHHD
ncbi:MAG: hypothetical protein ACYTBJ_00280 [Planctomycetota bacterium]|jgi:hypothetical protein